jgi:mono/diheme cytochrome c family protein
VFKRFVNAVEVAAGVAALVFVIALFANQPSGGGNSAASGPGDDVYVASCARCHGVSGQGGVGPRLAGGAVVRDFPNPADQIRLVENGRDGMPSFQGGLTAAEIRQVVAYTRTELNK